MVIECGGFFSSLSKNFVMRLFAQGVFLYLKSVYKKNNKSNKMFMVFEDAHKIIPNDSQIHSKEDIFEVLYNESRTYGLYNLIITRDLFNLPKNILPNCSIIIGHRTSKQDDAILLEKAFNRNKKFDDKEIEKWLYKEPTGQIVLKNNLQIDYKKPTLIKIDSFFKDIPTDEELMEHCKKYQQVD
ncbi:MAG: hypothetical protein ACOCP4_05455 [Candidatus Woesearchaeota archaeon]